MRQSKYAVSKIFSFTFVEHSTLINTNPSNSYNFTRQASTIRLADVTDYRKDEAKLCEECMMHTCSGYCMRHPKGKKKKKRCCRAGAGEEKTKNRNDTPGFPMRDAPAITHDHMGFLKLEMPRNHPRLVQAPLTILRGWRGICDFKILLYKSTNGKPHPEEISTVTDYVVAYQCKGNERIQAEIQLLRDFALK